MRTNIDIHLIRNYPLGPLDHAMHNVVRRGKNWIRRTFGKIPNDLPFAFGPGTTFELKGSYTSAIGDKITMAQAVTQSAYDLSSWAWDRTLPARIRIERGQPLQEIVRGNRFATVPKDGKTNRGICIEPGGNLYLQKGVGAYLKERLGAVGLYVWGDLPDNPTEWNVGRQNATLLHRRLARDGSRYGRWCSIDLSNASDTICKELVQWILPPDWHNLMDSVRSKATLFRGEWHLLNKFSSMGNGYTFELETAIFAALVHGVTGLTPGKDFYVYGDDILVPTEHSKDVLAVLKCFGLTPNMKKTFDTGPFRESCGGDYFIGYDVRPFQIKTLDGSILSLKAIHNGFAGKRLYRAARCASDALPTVHRTFGPSTYGDAVLHAAPSKWKIRHDRGIRWVTPLIPIFHSYPLDRWGDDSVIPQLLLGVKSTGYVPKGSEPVGWTRGWFSVS